MPTPTDDERATTAATGAAGAQRVRASSTSAHRVGVGAATESATATAEIPVVRVPQSRPGEPLSWNRYAPYAQGRPTGPLPAPAVVRLVVWLLVFLLVLMLIGFAVEIAHPDWLSFLRNTSSSSNAVALRSVPPGEAYAAATMIGGGYMVPGCPDAVADAFSGRLTCTDADFVLATSSSTAQFTIGSMARPSAASAYEIAPTS